MRITALALLLPLLPFTAAAADYSAHARIASSVVRVIARLPNPGSTSFGTGVVLPDGRVATNCHVIPGNQRVAVMDGGQPVEFERDGGDLAADLCMLRGGVLAAQPARIGDARTLKVGDEVVAIGFGAGAARSISVGRVTGLYAYRNARVIQTTAAFRQGASGGGLFDAGGNLVGITTFFRRGPSSTAFYAIPVDWIQGLALSAIDAQPPEPPFWTGPNAGQPLFLQVNAFEADGKWSEMEAAARLWTQEEPAVSQSWEALGRALNAKGDLLEGGSAMERARQAADGLR